MVKKAEEKPTAKVAELIQKAIDEQAAKQATDAETKIREAVEAAKQGEMFAQQKLLAEHKAVRETGGYGKQDPIALLNDPAALGHFLYIYVVQNDTRMCHICDVLP
jgi:hypothetical protein